MTEMKEVNDSDKGKPNLVNDDLVMKDIENGEEKKEVEEEDVEEVEEVEEEVEEEQEEEEEEEEVEEDTDESEEGEEDEQEKEVEDEEEVSRVKNSDKDNDCSPDAVRNSKGVHDENVVSKLNDAGVSEEVPVMKACNSIHTDVPESDMGTDGKLVVKDEKEGVKHDTEDGDDVMLDAHDSANNQGVDDEVIRRNDVAVNGSNKGSAALSVELMKEEVKNEGSSKEGDMDGECRNVNSSCIFDADTSGGGESGTEDEQAAFMNELERFHKEKFLEFKPPKFYGEPLNLLKLWRAVMKLGGYDKVTTCKYWRQVGESFKPPKTCTTVSWTFRIFYEKALLEYERHRMSGDGADIPASLPLSMSIENQASGSGRARRDAAARAMQGWHSQRILDNGEVSDPIIKDKNSASLSKREKQLKTLSQSILKRKKTPSMDTAVKDVRPKVQKSQSETTVIDIGSPADWVKINVRATKDCYEVYALVPGLLREEVRVQSDPAGRLVISGEPENPDNPWNVTPFKKVVNLPTRIDPHQTSAVVTLHGQLFVRVPFEQYD